jgi:hypothetical protein
MALPETPLSHICSQVRSYVQGVNGLNAAANNISVSTGAPADMGDADDQHRVNLFFYRFEPYGFDADIRPDQVWRVRLFCLVTVRGIDENDVPAGENDLRLLGELLRIFRRQPVFDAGDFGDEHIELQVVFSPVSDEQINQIWSTQGETTYRPSIIYEMALAPVIPAQRYVQPPAVGMLGNQAYPGMEYRHAGFSGDVQGPLVPYHLVDVDDSAWAPRICWLYDASCVFTLSFDVNGAAFAAFTPQIWVAGDTGDTVDLVWETWDSGDGWRSAGAPQTVTPFSEAIDPDHIPAPVPAAFPQIVTNMPVAVPGGRDAAQGLLYATRSVVRMPGEAPARVRSNPLLINLYRSA